MDGTFTLTLKLDLNKNEIRYFNNVFFYANHIYNVGVKEVIRRLNKLYRDPLYKSIMTNYNENESFTKEEKQLLKELRAKYGLDSVFSIEEYLKINRYQFSNHIPAVVVQKLANRLYQSVKQNLFKNGEMIYFKKYRDLRSIEGKTNKQDIVLTSDFKMRFQNRFYKVCIKKNDRYAQQILYYINFAESKKPRNSRNLKSMEYAINFCKIKRKRRGGSYAYYIEINIQGVPPHNKVMPRSKVAGIDIGTSTIAVYGENDILFKELNDGIASIDERIAVLNRKADRLRRLNNPENYKPDGTIKKNSKKFKKKWKKSNNLQRTYDQISMLYHKRSAKLRQFQNMLANEIITYGESIYIETMNYKSLQRRSKNTEISEKTGRYKKKKRFGKSISIHAPAQLVSIIETKLNYEGRQLIKVDNKAIKASQFNHLSGEYQPCKLKERWKQLDDNVRVQRDLYSAFLLSNVIDEKTLDKESCNKNFDIFKRSHDRLIAELYANKCEKNKKYPSCMGIDKKYIPDYITSRY